MKRKYTSALAGAASLLSAAVLGAQQPARAPLLFSDVPDVSMVRVGGTYYMSSTTMHYNPGVPVMVSDDLVNWRIASYCYDKREDFPWQSLEEGKNEYGRGSWASSIRYHDGWFYVSTFAMCDPKWRTYVFRTKDPNAGKWERFSFEPMVHDHSLWFEDGSVYMVGGGGNIRLYNLKSDFSGIEWEKEIVHEASAFAERELGKERGLWAEGSQLMKHGGWYYLFNICWPKEYRRIVICHRAKSLEGPWDEAKIVFDCEGIAQGSLVDTPDGRWYAYLFGDRGAIGRIPYLVEVEWHDGWPVFSNTPPRLPAPKESKPGIVASDDFSRPGRDESMSLQFQWNHNPVKSLWSLKERKGWLRLKTDRVDKDIMSARNTLTQRTFGPVSSAETRIDVSGLKPGDIAGLASFQHLPAMVFYHCLGKRKGEIVMAGHEGGRRKVFVRVPFSGSVVRFKVTDDFTNFGGRAQCFYAKDGGDWQRIGPVQNLLFQLEHFTGHRFALYFFSRRTPGGHADFDYFNIDRANPID